MSMNLAFVTTQGNHMIEFPYQTSTNISYSVLDATTKEDRLHIIFKDIDNITDMDDKDSIEGSDMLKQDVIDMLSDNTIKLIVI